MADEDPSEDDEFEDADDEEFDEDAPEPDDEFEDVDETPTDEEDKDEDEEDDADGARRTPAVADDEDEDEDPSDVEADLDEILRDRIAANNDEDEDEGKAPAKETGSKASVAPKRSDEWTCNQCFLIVSSSQFGTKDDPRCPSGEDPCESLARALG